MNIAAALKGQFEFCRRAAPGALVLTLLATLIALSDQAKGTEPSAVQRVWAWGDNECGQAVPDSLDPSPPGQVTGLTGSTMLSAGWNSSLALKPDGSVVEWGQSIVEGCVAGPPSLVLGLPPATAVAAGTSHRLALTDDGSVWGWGASSAGAALGQRQNSDLTVPEQITGISSLTHIDASSGISLALRSDNTVWEWGEIDSGSPQPVPQQVSIPAAIMQISASPTTSLRAAVDAQGDAWLWDKSLPPQRLSLGSSSGKQVAAGAGYVLIVDTDGHVWSWGLGASGASGYTLSGNPASNYGQPYRLDLEGISAVAAGQSVSFAISTSGQLWGWGSNQHGQLPGIPLREGDNCGCTATPTIVPNMPRVAQVAASFHTLAIVGMEPPVIDTPTSDALFSRHPIEVSGRSDPESVVALYLDGALVENIRAGIDGTWGTTIHVPEETHTITATSTDLDGNESPPSAPIQVTVDTLAPDTYLIEPPAEWSSSGSQEIAFSSSDAQSTFVCSWNETPEQPCISPAQKNSLPDGTHSFTARAIDAAGNRDPDPAAFMWTIDRTKPGVIIEPALGFPVDDVGWSVDVPVVLDGTPITIKTIDQQSGIDQTNIEIRDLQGQVLGHTDFDEDCTPDRKTCTYAFPLTAGSSGLFTVVVEATNRAGIASFASQDYIVVAA